MARLFRRLAAVTLAKPLTGKFFGQQPNAIVVTDLRIQFSIEKSLEREPNSAHVTITNLAERSRAEVQQRPVWIRLDAGYDGQLERVFEGDLFHGESMRESADWETKLQVNDGGRAFRFARVSRSYGAGVDAYTALREAAKAMGLEARFSPQAALELRAQYASGLVLQGPARMELDKVLAPYGMSWSIQDGRLQVLRAGEYRTEEPILISQDTGMVGVPDYGSPEKKGQSPSLTVKTLLQPSVTPGGRVQVASRQIRGTFRVERVVHEGDTHGETWHTTIEAKPLK